MHVEAVDRKQREAGGAAEVGASAQPNKPAACRHKLANQCHPRVAQPRRVIRCEAAWDAQHCERECRIRLPPTACGAISSSAGKLKTVVK